MATDTASLSHLVASRIVALRRRHGWSQRQLVDVLRAKRGVSMAPSAIAALETCKRRVALDEVEDFAAVFGVEPTALVSREPLQVNVKIE